MSKTHDLPEELRPIRVLFIVDSLYWVIGNFAHQITKNNPGIQAVTCSQFAIRKAINRFNSFPTYFDVIHLLGTKNIQGFWGALPIVTTFHHLDPATDLRPFHRSDAVMTVSSQWHNYLTQLGIPESHQTLVPFGVDTNNFYPQEDENRVKIRKALRFFNNAFALGFSSRRISNINNSKAVSCFLQALKKLRQDLPNLATLIIGPGWQALAKNIRQQGIPCTQAPYEITHERVAKYYQAMDLYWVTSRVEGGPVPLLEAMASGIPCISTPVGAALDLIKNQQNGFMVSFDSPKQFADLTSQLAGNRELGNKIGMEARKTILQERTWSQSQLKMLELYERAIKNFEAAHYQEFAQNWQGHRIKGTSKAFSSPKPTELDFFSPQIQKWMKACEHLNGLRMVLEMGEWKAAIQIGFRAIRKAPFDYYVWLELFKILMNQTKKKSPQP